MSGSRSGKSCGVCLTVAVSFLVLTVLWATLASPETALAVKPDKPDKPGGGAPDVLHGSVTFLDRDGDAVTSDSSEPDVPRPYVDAVDFTEVGLAEFFRLTIKLKKNGGRSLNVDFEGKAEEGFAPESENIWILWVQGSIADWRGQIPGTPVQRTGNLLLGITGKDEANVSYGRWGGSQVTVTLTEEGSDVWTIEGDWAVFYRHDVQQTFGQAAMPFKVTYNGQ
jgi:hypothetical protein